MSDLVERLREEAECQRIARGDMQLYGKPDPWLIEAADRIAELEARVKVLGNVADAARNVMRTEGAIAGRASMRVLARRLAALRDAGGA